MSWKLEGQRKKEKSRRRDDAVEVAETLGYDPMPISRGRKKNGKRWCRGKVGREHEYKQIRTGTMFRHIYVVDRCEACGKQRWR